MCGAGSGGRWPCPGPSSLPTSCTPLEKPSGDERQEPTSPTEAEARPPVCPEVLQLETVGAPAQAAHHLDALCPKDTVSRVRVIPAGRAGVRSRVPGPAPAASPGWGAASPRVGNAPQGSSSSLGGVLGVSVATHLTEDGNVPKVGGGGGGAILSRGGREGAEGQCFPRPGSLLSFAPKRLRQEPGGRGARSHPRAPSQTQDPAKAPREGCRHGGAGPLLIPKQRNPLCRLILCFHASWDRSR